MALIIRALHLHRSTVVHQSVKLLDSLGQPHIHLRTYPAVAHIALEGSYHSRRVDILDISVDSVESLQILLEGLSFFMLDKLQVVGPPWLLMAASEGANELMAQVSP